MNEKSQKVAVLMGSDSDLPVMKRAVDTLDDFDVESEVRVLSAHRTPEAAAEFAKNARGNGFDVIIAGAGFAAHLAGVVAAHTVIPVIGVPIDSSPLEGVDSLYSTVQMPPGVPVATVSVGKAGGTNAAILAVQILAIGNEDLTEKLESFKSKQREKIEKRQKRVDDAL